MKIEVKVDQRAKKIKMIRNLHYKINDMIFDIVSLYFVIKFN